MTGDVGDVLRGQAANWAMRSIVRDMTRELKQNGKRPPEFAKAVLETLADAAGTPAPPRIAASGSPAARVDPTSWLTVRDAAAKVGLSERRVRQLAQDHRVRARKPGTTWLIDPESLANVLRRRDD
mgnify:CR=1 FL=1